MSKNISRLSQKHLFIIFASFMFMGFLQRGSSPVVSILFYIIYGVSTLLIIQNYQRVLKVSLKDPFMWLTVIIALLSTFWSAAPDITLRKSIALIVATNFGIYLGILYSPVKLSNLLRWVTTFIATTSLVLSKVLPSYAYWIDPNEGGLRLMGTVGHPNHLGRLMALSIFLWLNHLLSCKTLYSRLVAICFVLPPIVALILTKSAGSLSLTVIVVSVFLALRFVNWFGRQAIVVFLIFIPISYIVYNLITQNAELLLSSVGRDTSLTGRGPLWEAVWQMIQRKPWLGYGFEAFWTGWEGPCADVWQTVGWKPPYAHNGFLDLWLYLGLFGICAFALSWLRNVFEVVKRLGTKTSQNNLLPHVILAFTVFANLTEGPLVSASYFWVLYVFASTSLSMQDELRKQQAPHNIPFNAEQKEMA